MWHERTSPLDPSSPNQFLDKEKEREKKESLFRERVSTFSEGTQPGFLFSNSGDPSGTPTDSQKTNLSFLLNLFKSESVERTHLYS